MPDESKAAAKDTDWLLRQEESTAELSHCFRAALVIWFHCHTEGAEISAVNPRYLSLT